MTLYRRKAFLVPGAFLLLLLVLYLCRGPLLASALRRLIVSGVERNFGVSCLIGEIGGNYLTELVLRDVRLAPAGQPGFTAAVREIRLSYAPQDYFVSLPYFISRLEVALLGLEAEADLEAVTRWRQGVSSTDIAPDQTLALPALRLRDGNLRITAGDKRFLIEGLEFEVSPAGDVREPSWRGALSLGNLRWELPGNSGQTSFSTKFDLFPDRVEGRDLFLAGKPVSRQVSVAYRKGEHPALTGRMELLGGTLHLEAASEEGGMQAKLHLAGADLAAAHGFPAAQNWPVRGLVNGEASLRLPSDNPADLEASASLELSGGAIGNFVIDLLRIKAGAGAGLLKVDSFDLTSGRNILTGNALHLTLPVFFQGDPKEMLQAAEGDLTLRLQDLPAFVGIFGGSLPSETPASVARYDLLLEGHLQDGVLGVSRGNFTSQAGELKLRSGRLRFPRGEELFQDLGIEADLELAVQDAEGIGGLLGFPWFTGAVAGRLGLAGPLSNLEYGLDFQGEKVAFRKVPLGTVQLKAVVAEGAIDLARCRMQRGRDSLLLGGGYDFRKEFFNHFFFAAEMAESADYLFFFPEEARVAGNLRLKGQVDGPLLSPAGALEFQASELTAWGIPLAAVDGELGSDGKAISLKRLAFRTGHFSSVLAGEGTADFAGSAFDFTVRNLSLSRSGHRWELRRPAHFSYTGHEGLVFEEFLLAGAGDTLSAKGTLSAGQELDLTARFSAVTGAGWLDLLSEGAVLQDAAFDLSVTGSAGAPQVTVRGGVKRLGAPDLPSFFTGEFDLSYTAAGIEARLCRWRTEEGSLVSVTGLLPLSLGRKIEPLPGPLDFTVALDIPELQAVEPFLPASYRCRGSLQAKAAFSGTWDDILGKLTVNAAGLTSPRLAELFVPLPLTVTATGTIRGDQLTVENFISRSPHFELQAAGSLQDLPRLPALLAGEGAVKAVGVSGRVRLTADDIGWLAAGTRELTKLAGAVRADLDLEGELAHPEVSGTILLEQGELWHNFPSLPPFKNLALESEVAGGMLMIRKMAGELGGAPFTVTGTVGASRGVPLDLRLRGENLLFYREDGVKVRADADLAFTGPLAKMKIAGDVALTDGSFTRKFDFLRALRGSFRSKSADRIMLPSVREPPIKEAELKIAITARGPFRVKNNVARGVIRPDLLLQGTGEVPYLVGRLYLEEGRLDLPAGRLYLDTGLINFPADDPDRPLVEILGRSRIAGYDLTVNIEGRLEEPIVTLTSVPPLPEDDLLYLVLTGKPPVDARTTRTTGSPKNMKVALYLAEGVLDQLFAGESPLSETDLLERFEIGIGKEITRKGDETIDVQFRLLEEVVTKGGTLYITSEKDVYDEFNMGLRILIRFD